MGKDHLELVTENYVKHLQVDNSFWLRHFEAESRQNDMLIELANRLIDNYNKLGEEHNKQLRQIEQLYKQLEKSLY